MTDFTQDLFARRRNASDGNTRVVSAGRLWYDSITNTMRVSDGHTPGGQIVTGQSGSYTLPTATPSVKGGVQLGANVIAAGALIDVLQPTRVSQLENDSNYLSGAVLATYATQTFVTTQGYITSAALATGNANVIAANSRITAIDANIGAYQIWANANIAGLSSNAGTQATSINRLDANIGAYQIWANTSIFSRDANLGTATTNITTLSANLGTATTNISNLVTQANANTTALLASSVTTGPLTVDSRTGGYFANISGAAHPAYGRQSWQFFSQLNTFGGPGSWILFPDGSTQTTAYPGSSTSLSTFDANLGTATTNITALDANLGTATTNISNLVTQSNANTVAYLASSVNLNFGGVAKFSGGNVFVPGYTSGGGTTINQFGIYNEAVDQNQVFQNATNGLASGGGLWAGGAGLQVFSSAEITFRLGATLRSQNTPTGGTNASGQNITFSSAGQVTINNNQSSTSTTTGALVVKGGAGIAGNVYAGGNIEVGANLTVAQSGLFRGAYDENSILSGVFVGNTGTAPGVTPRVGFFNGNTQQNWQIDNNAGAFRWFVPGSTKMTLYDTGNLNVTGGYTIGGKKAVNGPAFSAYANATLQTITTGSQQKVLFQTEEFDTDNCYTNSRFTPNVEGYYQLNAQVRLDGVSGTGEMMIVIYKNTTEHKRGTNQQGTQIAANFWAMTVSSLVYANGTSDYFEIYVQQTSGSSVTVTAVNATNITWFNGAMVRGA